VLVSAAGQDDVAGSCNASGRWFVMAIPTP
jgi:hypothetical protein